MGPVALVAALVAGVLVGEGAGAGVAPLTIVFGSAVVAAAVFTPRRVRVVAGMVGCAALGAGLAARGIDGQHHSPLTAPIASHSPATLHGSLVHDADGTSFAISALVRVDVGGGRHRTVLVTASGHGAMVLRALAAGDRVTVRGRLAPLRPGRFDDRARWEHAVGRLDTADVVAVAPASGVLAAANAARGLVLRGTAALPPTTRALVAGFLLGDTRAIPSDVTAAYRDAGLSHLLAVSGENVAFVLALAGPLLRRLRLGLRTAAALGVVAFFAAMTRFEPSVLRASAMAAIVVVTTFAGRPIAGLRVLAYAVIVLVLVDPFLVHSVAFALSCSASAGIALLRAPIARRLRGPRWVRDPLAVSLAAQVGVVPVLLAAFGSYPLLTPLTNLLAVPAADLLGVYGAGAALAAGVVPALGPVVQFPTAVLVGWITAVARAGAALSPEVDARGTVGVLSVIAAGSSVACLRAARARPDPASRPP